MDKPRLGRGLDALLGGSDPAEPAAVDGSANGAAQRKASAERTVTNGHDAKLPVTEAPQGAGPRTKDH